MSVSYQHLTVWNHYHYYCLTSQDQPAGHLPENLLNYEETTGAADTINKLIDKGHEIFIITGRPFNSYEPSRKWLDEHNLKRVPLYCVDKYGRETSKQDYAYNMTLEQLYDMTFDFVIEDLSLIHI